MAGIAAGAGNKAKYVASSEAVRLFVTRPNMRIGLGSGSTVVFVAKALAAINSANPTPHNTPANVGGGVSSPAVPSISSCVPTSYQSRELIVANDLPLRQLDQNANSSLHVTIDGADEVARCKSGGFVAIKGGGGCLLQEKVIAAASESLVIVVKSSKVSQHLGQYWTKGIPIEVLPMAQSFVSRKVTSLFGGVCTLRMATAKMGPIVTDNGNFILDWVFPLSTADGDVQANDHANGFHETNKVFDSLDWARVDEVLQSIPGLIETGLFVNMATAVVSADDDGNHEVLYPSS